MRARIALATASAVILIPVVLLLTVFSGSPSASVRKSGRHEALAQSRATHAVTRLRAEETQKLAAFYNAVNESTWLTAVYKSQLTTFYNAVNESAWYSAVYNSQLANFYAAINQSEQQAAAASAAAAAAPAPASSSSTSSGGGGWTGPWACIAEHESGGNPGEDTGNGYYGGLQFSLGTWEAYGGTGNPADASIGEQEAVAERILAAQGWGAWPNTSRECGE